MVNKTLYLLQKHYKEQPNNIAIVDDTGSFTWAQLFSYTFLIASTLSKNDVKKGDVVTIELPSSKEFIASIIACQMLGLIYVPVGNSLPELRAKYIRQDCKAKINITNSFLSSINEKFAKGNQDDIQITPIDVNQDDIEMIIYTSGSTGVPKGVIHTVSSFNSAITRAQKKFSELHDNDRYATVAPLNFILGVQGSFMVLTALAKNIRLYLVPFKILFNPKAFLEYFIVNEITKAALNVNLAKLFVLAKTKVERLFIGGEITRDCYIPGIKAHNGFGASEVGGASSAFEIDKPYENTPIGEPFYGLCNYLLDENNHISDRGELCISGDVALGYLNQESETKKHFIDNPFYAIDGNKRMFKTGDIGYKDKNGNIFITGRKDWMVNINGQRVEIEEIEYAIGKFPKIKQVAVRFFENVNGNNLLCAYISQKEPFDIDELKKELAKTLPSYMIPRAFIVMEKFPVALNGKINRLILPPPSISENKNYLPPTSPIEKKVCDAFQTVFKLDQVGLNDDFMALGGDSIAAIKLLTILKDCHLTIVDILSLKTVKQISDKASHDSKLDYVVANKDAGTYLSEPQLNVYLDILINKKDEAYLIPFKIDLNYSSLEVSDALKRITEVHPILRTYIGNGQSGPLLKYRNDNIDIQILDQINKKTLDAFLTSPFNLNKSLARYLIVKKSKGITLYVVVHHIIFDGLSTLVFINDLKQILHHNAVAYDDIYLNARGYQDALIKTPLFKEATAFYDYEFSEANSLTELVPDVNVLSNSYISSIIKVDEKVLNSFLKKYSITKSIFFTSVFAYVLSRFTNTSNSYFALIENGRDRLSANDAIGMFVNTLPIVIDCQNDSIFNFINKSKEKILNTIKYDFYPFRILKNKYNIQANISFQYVPNLDSNHNFTVFEKEQRKDLIANLTASITEKEDSYLLEITSNNKYSHNTINRFLEVFKKILNEILIKDNLKDINYTLEEDIKVINKINATETKLKYHDILEAFNDSLKQYPNNTLVSYLDTKYTYREGAKWINNLTNKLNNIPKKSNIAILVHRSHYYLLGALSVLNHGSAYVPIDDTYPDERVKFMLSDSDIKA